MREAVPGLPAEQPFSPPQLRWRLHDLLPRFASDDRAAGGPVRSYLADGDPRKRFELADRLARVFDRCLVYRPDWIRGWERGDAPHWQARLWRRAVEAEGSSVHWVGALDAFRAALERGPRPADWPSRASFFAVSALSPSYLDVLRGIGRGMELHLFVVNPCREYWGDIYSRREMGRRADGADPSERHLTEGNELLAAWGRAGRDTFDSLVEIEAVAPGARGMNDLEIQHHFADVGEVSLHYVTTGAGLGERPPLVLRHGWPQTWYEWRQVMPRLVAAGHPVIAPDLRGLGDSSRPLEGYDKRTVADDIFGLLNGHLGLDRWHGVGHDWGGPVTFALGARDPGHMLTMTIIDVVIPGDGGDFSQGGRRWHHAFHRTPDLPEALVTGRERAYLGWFYREFAWRRDAIDAEAVDEYLRTYTEPGALRAGFAYYRNLPRDAADNRALLETGFRLPMPVLAIGGGKTESRGRATEPEESMRRVARDVTGVVIAESGHFVPEEQPELVAAHILDHVARHE